MIKIQRSALAVADEQLKARIEPGVGYLVFSAEVDRPWLLGLNVDASIIVDCDVDGWILNIDCFDRGRRSSKRHEPLPDGLEGLGQPVKLQVDRALLAKKEIRNNVKAVRNGDWIRVAIGERSDYTALLPLSSNAVAIMNESNLVGLLARLPWGE